MILATIQHVLPALACDQRGHFSYRDTMPNRQPGQRTQSTWTTRNRQQSTLATWIPFVHVNGTITERAIVRINNGPEHTSGCGHAESAGSGADKIDPDSYEITPHGNETPSWEPGHESHRSSVRINLCSDRVSWERICHQTGITLPGWRRSGCG